MPGSFYLNTPENSPGIMAGADPAWQLKQQAVEQSDAFKGGVPSDAAGNLDYGAMARTMFQRGGLEPGIKLLEAGVAQKQLADAGKLSEGMSKWLVPGGGAETQPAVAPSAVPMPAKGGNPEVVAYFRERSPAYGINPNAALSVASKEGLFGFDPAGKPNPGDNNSSFGPLQLHYGGVASGGNAVPGLGDDFTKATGLDARDPSTWKQQVDFALAHAAKNGWGAWHGAIKAGIPEWAGIDRGGTAAPVATAAPAPAPAGDGRPIQLAQNGDSDAPPTSSRNPYAASSPSFAGPTGAPAARSYAPASAPQPAAPQMPPATPSDAQASPRPAPMPISFGPPPPISPNAGSATPAGDESYGGQIPAAWLKTGRSAADFVRYSRAMAAIGSGNPYAKGFVDQWGKIADGLEKSIQQRAELTTEQKNARDPGAIAYEHQRDDYNYQAREQAKYLPGVVAARSADAASTAEAKQSGEALGKIPAQLAADADGARTQNATIDEMIDASRQFQMGKFADKEQALNSTLSALGHKLNVDTSSIDGKVAGYEAYAKLAGQFSRQAMKETGGRAGGIQELRFITNTLPSPTMSQAGFEAVANQLKGLGDFKVAKQQAGAAWQQKTGSMQGFDADWNKNVTPSAFVMHRLQVDQPEVFTQTVTRLAQSAQGRSVLKSMRTGMSYAGSNGLFD